MWKIKNKMNEPRKFREHKTAELHFLRAGEEIIIGNPPATDRIDIFEITDLNKINLEEEQEVPKRKATERRSKK